jgi:hypothetical protein
VLEFCTSERFREALQLTDYVVVQIDTDVSDLYGVDHRNESGDELSVLDLISRVREVMIQRIGTAFHEASSGRILFAISVQSIECWLLPLHFPNDKSKRAKTTNCLGTLNQALKKAGFTIDPNNKSVRYYEQISRDYTKHKTFMKLYPMNPSLAAFVEQLAAIERPTV